MSPEDASRCVDLLKVGEWLKAAEAEDILLCMNHCVKNISSTAQLKMAEAALAVRLAIDAEETANKVVGLTEKLVRLTWGLFALTLVLALVAAAQLAIMFAEHAAKAP